MKIADYPNYKVLADMIQSNGNTKCLYFLTGKSGTGKDTMADILNELFGLKKVKSVTTRARRYPTEDVYYYISDEEYDNANLVQHATFSGCRYGATLEEVNASQLFVICPEGMPELVECYKERPIVALYLDSTDETRRARMRSRGDSEESIQKRIEHDATQFGTIPAEIPVTIIDANQEKDDVIRAILDAMVAYETNAK